MAVNSNQSHAFIGKGKIFMTPITGAVRGKPFWVGVASALSFAHSVADEKELIEHHSGTNQVWDMSDGTKKTTVSLTIQERRLEAMRAALQATTETVVTGSVVAEPHVVDAIGDYVFLKYSQVSVVTVTDSTVTTPVSLVEGTDYKIDAEYGRIEMLTTGHASPLNIGYSYGAATVMKPMTDSVDFYEIRVDGMNTVGQKDKQIVTAYRVKLNPADAIDLINDDFAEMKVEGIALFDEVLGAAYEIKTI
ncbi:conserved hypothetical protein [Psychrobacter arcticus 273-4]|uniref:Uncharacterized protein n=1 Tax=Psychrobacter arcticus (strain DSM 17307 / VKM B-2377 / 273-4) TaxID=259536 RepID=Q4FSZ4_PSYA2|nr:hypothetical protein [Psychrobacter arcticus]AAZ18864.1 conserved hypothetical protein [Psychrobacter arcticus 273-4]